MDKRKEYKIAIPNNEASDFKAFCNDRNISCWRSSSGYYATYFNVYCDKWQRYDVLTFLETSSALEPYGI